MTEEHAIPARRFTAVLVFCLSISASSVWATNYYVKSGGDDNADGLSWATAFATISESISTATSGDVIDVNEGTYTEYFSFSNKSIWLRSTDPNDPNVVAATIIDADNPSVSVVVFSQGEDANSILDGITVTGGNRSIYCANGSSPTLRNCVFRDNAYYGIRTYSNSSPVLENCLITGNTSYGADLYGGAAQLSGCRIQDNGSYGVYGYSSYSGTVSNCIISGNSNYGVRSASASGVKVVNCTVVGNSGGVSGTFDEITNCIVWGNGDDLTDCSATYSCIEDPDTGTGNIHANPLFLDADNDDYHLWYSSYCIDAGDPCSVYGNEPDGGGGRVNIGAYGNTAEARTIIDADSDGLDDTWEQLYWPGDDPNLHDPNDDPDGDGLRNKDEYYVHWDPNSDDSGSIIGFVYNTRVDVNYPSISLAVSFVFEDDVLVLEPHTYQERFSFPGVPIHIRSTDPNDPNVVATTIIDPDDSAVSVVGFGLGQDANSILDGITVTGGQSVHLLCQWILSYPAQLCLS